MNSSYNADAEKCFQAFNYLKGHDYLLVSEQLVEDLKNVAKEREDNSKKDLLLVQRYLSIDRFVDSVVHQYFYLAAPSTWEDPFETKYIDVLNNPELMNNQNENDRTALKEMSVLCSCMTYNDSDNEEASWKAYEDKERLIRVTYDFHQLCNILNSTKEKNFYVGKVYYKSRKEILQPKGISFKGKEEENNKLEILFVNNFCSKQLAYMYEKELRFCKILKGEQFKDKKNYRIEPINLTPAISKITLPPINYKKLKIDEVNGKLFEQIKIYLLLKSICPKVPIYVSNLYDSRKEEMYSEITLLTKQKNKEV